MSCCGVSAGKEWCSPPGIDSIFDDVYEELPWHLREQRDYLRAQARTRSPHQHG